MGIGTFFVDVESPDYIFYYNMGAEINKNIVDTIGRLDAYSLYRSDEAYKRIKDRGWNFLPKHDSAHLGRMVSYDKNTKSMVNVGAVGDDSFMAGICAYVSSEIAEAVLQRAIYYCPKDTGLLASSGYIEQLDNGQCLVKFDCPYAWFVHEFSWKKHKIPTTHHFLTIAKQEVETWLQGLS